MRKRKVKKYQSSYSTIKKNAIMDAQMYLRKSMEESPKKIKAKLRAAPENYLHGA